jgi:hypothetical protein
MEIFLSQVPVGTLVSVVDAALPIVGLESGTLLQVMRLSAKGSMLVVQQSSGEHLSLNSALTSCIRVQMVGLDLA